MPYILPNLSELINQDIKTLDENPKLAAILTKISKLLENPPEGMNKDESRACLVGAYLYCMESINQEYLIHSPELKSGYLYNSGSPLYSELAKILKHDTTNPITARERLIYINKFYQFILNNKNSVDDSLKEQKLTHQELLTNAKTFLGQQLKLLTINIANIINAIPSEKVMTNHMETLPEKYSEAKKKAHDQSFFGVKENPWRIFLAQLAQAISTIKCEEEEGLPHYVFTGSQRIKMGALIYIKNIIAKEYVWLSPLRSDLYKQSLEILNTINRENLVKTQQLECLNSFKSYIQDHNARGEIERFGLKHFKAQKADKNIRAIDLNHLVDLNTTLETVAEQITAMTKELNESLISQWPATTAFATLGMILGAAPGYRVGSAIGQDLGDAYRAKNHNEIIGQGVSRLATAYFGRPASTGSFLFLVGDFVISSNLSCAIIKLFEVAGMAVGGVVGGAAGFTCDLTYKGFKEICNRYLEVHKYHPERMQHADPELVQCLRDLPEELLSREKQKQMRYTLGESEEATPKVTACPI